MKKICIMACLLLLTGACFKMPLNRSLKLGKPIENFPIEKVPVKGTTVAVRSFKPGGKAEVKGELLAAGDGFIWVLQDGKTVHIPERIVRDVELQDLFPSGAGALGAWTALGTASTVSHTFAAIITAPLWLAVGIPASVSAANANDLTVKPKNFNMLYQWARYPQGMPSVSNNMPPPWAPGEKAGEKIAKQPAQPKDQKLPVPPAEKSSEPVALPAKPPPSPPSIPKPAPIPSKRVLPPLAQVCPPLPGGEPSCGAMLVEGKRALWVIGRARADGDGDEVAMRQLAAMRARERLARTVIIDRWHNKKEGAFYAVVALPLSACGLDAEAASRLFARYSEKKGGERGTE